MNEQVEHKTWPQRLGSRALLVAIHFQHVLTAFSIGVYTPALPGMIDYFSTMQGIVRLSLTMHLVCNAVGLLLFGTLSDLFGRKLLLP